MVPIDNSATDFPGDIININSKDWGDEIWNPVYKSQLSDSNTSQKCVLTFVSVENKVAKDEQKDLEQVSTHRTENINSPHESSFYKDLSKNHMEKLGNENSDVSPQLQRKMDFEQKNEIDKNLSIKQNDIISRSEDIFDLINMPSTDSFSLNTRFQDPRHDDHGDISHASSLDLLSKASSLKYNEGVKESELFIHKSSSSTSPFPQADNNSLHLPNISSISNMSNNSNDNKPYPVFQLPIEPRNSINKFGYKLPVSFNRDIKSDEKFYPSHEDANHHQTGELPHTQIDDSDRGVTKRVIPHVPFQQIMNSGYHIPQPVLSESGIKNSRSNFSPTLQVSFMPTVSGMTTSAGMNKRNSFGSLFLASDSFDDNLMQSLSTIQTVPTFDFVEPSFIIGTTSPQLEIVTQPRISDTVHERRKQKFSHQVDNEEKGFRGKYKCGRCGQPKVNHVCEYTLEVDLVSSATQATFDIPRQDEKFIVVSDRSSIMDSMDTINEKRSSKSPVYCSSSGSQLFGHLPKISPPSSLQSLDSTNSSSGIYPGRNYNSFNAGFFTSSAIYSFDNEQKNSRPNQDTDSNSVFKNIPMNLSRGNLNSPMIPITSNKILSNKKQKGPLSSEKFSEEEEIIINILATSSTDYYD